MTGDYTQVTRALGQGADPGMLCSTCPWDRNCITPPSVTSAEVDEFVARANAEDAEEAARLQAQGKPAPFVTGGLLTRLFLAGKETQASLCPVLALRLRTSAGKTIADGLKGQMQGWDDQA